MCNTVYEKYKTKGKFVMMDKGVDSKKKTIYPTMKDLVLIQLREDVLSGKLEPEQVLNINDLAAQYNVSRTPIREALSYLESMGLVEIINYRCIKVAKFLSDEVHEIYYMRAALSGLSARLAARNMTISEKQKLIYSISEARNFLKDNNIDAFLENNREFHDSMASFIKTPLIKNLYEQFYIITKRYRMLGMKVRNDEQLISEHEIIAQAIFSGNEEEADFYGRIHYLNTIKFLD